MFYNILFFAFFLSLSKLYEAKECYVCLEKCVEPMKTITCNDTDRCFTIEVNLSGTIRLVEKGCLPSSRECDEANGNDGTTCTSCDTELCNGNGNVQECHFCDGTCSSPLETQKCSEVAIGNDGVGDRMCLDAELQQDGAKKQWRRCISADEASLTCSIFGQLGGICNVCSASLCNDRGNHSSKTAGSTILILGYILALCFM